MYEEESHVVQGSGRQHGLKIVRLFLDICALMSFTRAGEGPACCSCRPVLWCRHQHPDLQEHVQRTDLPFRAAKHEALVADILRTWT